MSHPCDTHSATCGQGGRPLGRSTAATSRHNSYHLADPPQLPTISLRPARLPSTLSISRVFLVLVPGKTPKVLCSRLVPARSCNSPFPPWLAQTHEHATSPSSTLIQKPARACLLAFLTSPSQALTPDGDNLESRLSRPPSTSYPRYICTSNYQRGR